MRRIISEFLNLLLLDFIPQHIFPIYVDLELSKVSAFLFKNYFRNSIF